MSNQLTHALNARLDKLEIKHAQQKLWGKTSQLTQDDHFIYFNSNLKNTSLTTEDIKAEFEANRRDNILENPSDFVCAIDRFKIPSNLIPIMEFEDNINEVIMTYDGAEVREYVQWVPTSVPQITRQWIFHYQHFLDMLNTTISSVHAALLILKPALPNDIPFVTYNSDTNLFDLYFDETWLAVDTAKLGFNQPLSSLFEFHRDAILLANESVDYYELVAENTFNNFIALTTPLVPYSANFYISHQPFTTINTWSPISRILISTNRLPIRRELIASQQSVSEQILTDFVPNHDDVNNLEYIFNAGSGHRWHDLESNQPLKDIDLKIEWENYKGVKHPVLITYNREASIKLLFKQRGDITTN